MDTHVHVVHQDDVRYPRVAGPSSRALPGGEPPGSGWFRDLPMPVEEMERALDAGGVSRAVLVQPFDPYRFDNSYLTESVARTDSRFVGVGILDVTHSNAGERLEDLVTKRGMRGVRFFAMGVEMQERVWRSPCTSFWAAAADLGVPVTLQIEQQDRERLATLATANPRVSLVLDHLAATRTVSELTLDDLSDVLDLARLPNLSVKYSSVNLQALLTDSAPGFVASLVSAFGADRVMWGSNFPATRGLSYATLVQLGVQSVSLLSPEAQGAVLGGNAARVWRVV